MELTNLVYKEIKLLNLRINTGFPGGVAAFIDYILRTSGQLKNQPQVGLERYR